MPVLVTVFGQSMAKAIWEDPKAQEAFERRSEFDISDNAKYFFDRIDQICDAGYSASEEGPRSSADGATRTALRRVSSCMTCTDIACLKLKFLCL